MASNINIQKKCEWCGKLFIAHKISTRCCSRRCANLAYKEKQGKNVLANSKQWSISKSKKKIALTRISLPQAKLQSISVSAGLPFIGI